LWEEELVFSENVEDFSDDSAMFFQVFGEHEDVVDVYTYDAATDEVLEKVIHHSLEGGRAVSHAIKHYQWFKQPLITPKGHCPFISFLDSDVLVTPSDIEFSEVFGTA
jgi:hypothetical protein